MPGAFGRPVPLLCVRFKYRRPLCALLTSFDETRSQDVAICLHNLPKVRNVLLSLISLAYDVVIGSFEPMRLNALA